MDRGGNKATVYQSTQETILLWRYCRELRYRLSNAECVTIKKFGKILEEQKKRENMERECILKITAFWHTARCNLVETDRCFKGMYCLHNQDGESHRQTLYFWGRTIWLKKGSQVVSTRHCHKDIMRVTLASWTLEDWDRDGGILIFMWILKLLFGKLSNLVTFTKGEVLINLNQEGCMRSLFGEWNKFE
jgi:hypothetical protein